MNHQESYDMSNQTVFRLESKDDFPHILQVAQVLVLTASEPREKNPSEAYETPSRMDAAMRHWTDILTGDEQTTWDEHQADMAHVSALWPKVEFNLYLIGDDAESCALEYYRDGLVQCAPARVEYPEFDLELLTKPEGKPEDIIRPDTFFHRGWLLRARTGGYWAVPIAIPAQPDSTGTETSDVPPSQGFLINASCRAEALRTIHLWNQTGWVGFEPGQATRKLPGPSEARAKQAVLDAVREKFETADPETALVLSEWLKTAALPGD